MIILALIAATAATSTPQRPDSAVFVTRLGADTLVVERVVRTPRRIEAEVLMRVPRTTRTLYVADFSPEGDLMRLEGLTFDPRVAADPVRRETITRDGDTLRVVIAATGAAERTRAVAADKRALPFIDMVHWPFEPALMRLKASGAAQAQQPLLSGSRVADFGLAAVGADSATITHPTRGTMRVRVDAQGRLLALDAGATTRKLVVERKPWMAIDQLADRWSADDAAGRSLGALSGRGEVKATVAGAAIAVDHGTPAKRGRDIWGALVPYGVVWRTGANSATGFTTDRDLIFGTGQRTLLVPAGAYTLFSIPEQSGGVLIVSRDTGQAGTAYDPAKDLGRVPLEARPLATPVEIFAIAVTPDGDGGLLRLQWDRTEMVARFRVAPRPE